jgi:hypothetical protein
VIKFLLLILSVIIIFSCVDTQNKLFKNNIICAPDSLQQYDGNRVTILDENDKPIKDTIFDYIKKRRDVFKPCRQLIYRAILKDSLGNILTNSRIRLTPTGKRWIEDSDKQDEVVIEYEYSSDDFKQSKIYSLNKVLNNLPWEEFTKTGVIENVDEVWMHPFRRNQFKFTEVAPFPHVRFPLEIGKTWTQSLNIQEGWGDWENTYGSFEYIIVSNDSIETKAGLIKNCWKIESHSFYEFGKSELVFWFNERLGFVRKEYKNYGKQTLSILLEEINENSK